MNKFARGAVTACLSVAVLFFGYKMIESWFLEKKAAQEYEKLTQYAVVAAAQENIPQALPEEALEEEAAPEVHYPAMQIDMAALKEINGDFRGWLYFPVLDISYPVVQGEDNDVYLKRSFEGEHVNAGCIFMDCEADSSWSDRNTFVFGHNMRDGSMFGTFKKLVDDTELVQENPYFYIYTEDWVYTYQIFAYYTTKKTSDRYMTFTTDYSYDVYVQWARDNSLIASDADLSERGNIVSLSTCYGSAGTSRRVLIHGVMVAKEEYRP